MFEIPHLTDEGKKHHNYFLKKYSCGEIDYGYGTIISDNSSEDFFWVSFWRCSNFNPDSLVLPFSIVAKDLLDHSNKKGIYKKIRIDFKYDSDGTYFEHFYFDIRNDSLIYANKEFNPPPTQHD